MKSKNSGSKLKKSRKERNLDDLRTEQDFNPLLLERFNQYLCKRRVAYLRERLADYYGKNFVIDYQDRFNFEQQWEDKLINATKTIEDGGLQENPIEIASSIIIAITLTINLWVSTVDLIFRYPQNANALEIDRQIYDIVYWVGLFVICSDILLKLRKKINNKTFECSLKRIILSFYKGAICLISLAIKIQHMNRIITIPWIIFELVAIIFIYSRASQLYSSLRLISYSLYYQYHSKICDLIITLFFILNIIAIVLFLSTFLGYENTWLSKLGINRSQEFTVYIYSFYYASTTILTVGYGDLSPQNTAEVVLIVMIQIMGVATLGYIISEIGYCISNLRKGRETMEKDLSIILKMRKHYNMNDKLLKEARSFIINNKHEVDQLYPAEEKCLLSKFNEELRNNITQENLSSVIKSSIFFITRWSISFQRAISRKLEHILFSPNDLLYQPKSKERIYIIKSGKINIYAEKGGRKKGQKNLLKTIDNTELKQISDNCYGYTAVISTRPCRLYAIAKNITSAYYIDKENFVQCLTERFSDYEYYHEIKSKMDHEDHWESFEAPLIESSKNHYNPTKKPIIRKYLKSHSQQHNLRNSQKKRLLRSMNMLAVLDQEQRSSIRSRIHRNDTKHISSFPSLARLESVPKYTVNLQSVSEEVPQKSLNNSFLTFLAKEVIEGHDLKTFFDHFFEIGKQYNNYFPRRNPSFVLKKIELEYVLPNPSEEEEAEFNNAVYKASRQQI